MENFMRSKYWSNGKFADFVRGTPSLECGTGEEWRDWRNNAKTKHPIRFWIAEEFMDKVQNFIMYPIDKLYSIKYWFLNYFVTKTHALTSNLKKGQWHEFDTRLLHCAFDELVNFVEVEKSWKNIICDKDAAKKYNAPWHSYGWGRLRTWRNAESGLDYLKWETTLMQDESWGYDKDHPEFGKPTQQAERAKEIIKLYNWWKFERPNRVEPMDASGWSEFCDRKRSEKGGDFWDFMCAPESEEDSKESRRLSALCDEIEKEYQDEDTEMLIKLISIRNSLWT